MSIPTRCSSVSRAGGEPTPPPLVGLFQIRRDELISKNAGADRYVWSLYGPAIPGTESRPCLASSYGTFASVDEAEQDISHFVAAIDDAHIDKPTTETP